MQQVEEKKLDQITPPIKTIEDLSKSILNDPDKSASFHKFIESKYGLESKGEILNVTQVELESLKKELDSGTTNYDNIGKLVYEDYLETSLENKGLASIDVDMLTQGEESSRLIDIKNQFEGYFDANFSKYDFISTSQKELFKISIVNKLLNSQMLGMGENMLGGFSKTVTNVSDKLNKGEYSQAIDEVSNTTDMEESSDMMEQALKAHMEVYISKLDTIHGFIQKNHPELTQTELQNVFSNIDSFKNPLYIETEIQNFDITTVDFSKITTFNNDINVDEMKNYILKSKDNIHETAKMLAKGDKVQEVVLELISDKNFGGAMKGFLGILLKIPFIGDLISNFLGLDKKDPMGSLEKMSGKYNFFQGLLSQGKINSKESSQEGKGVFKNIDFGEQNFQENKGSIEKIMSKIPQLDEKSLAKFWQDSFSEKGFLIKGIALKFSGLNDSDNFETGINGQKVMKQGVLSDILNSGISEYENNLGEQEISEKQKAQTQAEKIKTEKINALEATKDDLNIKIHNVSTKISTLTYMLDNSKMSEIDDWDDWFNIGDITDISLSKIKNISDEKDILSFLQEELGEDDISTNDMIYLKELCIQIKEFYTTHPLNNKIETIGDLYDNALGDSKLFFDNLGEKIKISRNEIETLQGEQKSNQEELSKLGVEPTQEELLARNLLSINEGNISEGLQFGDYQIKYNPDNGELLIGELKYNLYFGEKLDNNFSDIGVKKGIVEFLVYGQTIPVNKMSVIDFLSKSILNKENINIFESDGKKITLKKQTA